MKNNSVISLSGKETKIILKHMLQWLEWSFKVLKGVEPNNKLYL